MSFKGRLAQLRYLSDKNFRKLPIKTLIGLLLYTKNDKITLFEDTVDINQGVSRFPSPFLDRNIEILKGYNKGEWHPITVFISVTDRCVSNCEYCYNGINNARNQQDLPSWKIRELLAAVRQHEPNLYQVCFTGGEPLLRNDITELVKEASKEFFTFLNTSGFGLTAELAKDLKQAGLGALKVSLDYHDPEFVNRRRGHAKAFDMAVNAIKIGVEQGHYVIVGMVSSPSILEKKNFLAFVDFLEKLGVHALRINTLKPSGRQFDAKAEDFYEKQDKIIYDYHVMINRDSKYKLKLFSSSFFESEKNLGCPGGCGQFYINADGSVNSCPFLNLSLGNVNDEDLGAILARLRKHFQRPLRYCVTRYVAEHHAEELTEAIKDNDLSKAEALLEKLPKSELPDAYKLFIK